MTLTAGQAIASIAVMAAVTFLTRAIPFLLFDRKGNPPQIVLYLGRVLPPAIIMMLIIYCLRGVTLFSGSHGIPELVCVAVAAGCIGGRATICCPFSPPPSCICFWYRPYSKAKTTAEPYPRDTAPPFFKLLFPAAPDPHRESR